MIISDGTAVATRYYVEVRALNDAIFKNGFEVQ